MNLPGSSPSRTAWLHAAAAAAVVGVAAVLAATSFDGWYVNDDIQNVRWALEYLDSPWKAVTERHSVHDHVRPLSLLLTWVGVHLSDGEWWGPHTVLVALVLLAVLAALAWGMARTRHVAGAWMVGLAFLSLPGFYRLLNWNAQTGTAAELAFGLLALVVGHHALARRSLGLVALVPPLLLLAGAAKEPGWVVYPATLVTMAWSARPWEIRSGRARRAALPAIALAGVALAVGLAGMAWSWHPANLSRYAEVETPFQERVLTSLQRLVEGTVGGWTPSGSSLQGLWAPLVLLALWRGLLAPRVAASARVPRPISLLQQVWPVLALITAVLLVALPPARTPGLVLLVGLVLVRHAAAPPPELVLLAVSVGIMLPYAGAEPVQCLAGSLGLSAFVARQVLEVATGPRRPTVHGRWTQAAVLAVLATGQGALGIVQARIGVKSLVMEDVRDGFYELGAMIQTLQPESMRLGHLPELDDESTTPYVSNALWPLYGADLPGEGRADLTRYLWVDGLLLGAPEQAMEDLEAVNLLPPMAPGLSASGSADLDLAPGFFAMGARWASSPDLARVGLADGCHHRRTLQRTAADVRSTWTSFLLREGCGPLRIHVDGVPSSPADVLLVQLVPPRVHLPARELGEPSRFLRVKERTYGGPDAIPRTETSPSGE